MQHQIQAIQNAHWESILNIYNHYVLHSTANFYTQPITLQQLQSFVASNPKEYPSLCMLQQNQVIGFAYCTYYKPRQAYNRTAEISVYLHPSYIGQGLGSAMATHMELLLKPTPIQELLAVVTAHNQSSIAMFKKLGYEQAGLLHRVGKKFNQLLDVVIMQKSLTKE